MEKMVKNKVRNLISKHPVKHTSKRVFVGMSVEAKEITIDEWMKLVVKSI